MALHAGFAAALSFTKASVQDFIHAAYVNDLIPGRIHGKTSSFAGADIAYDFEMLEPTLELTGQAFVTLRLDLLGTLTFTAEGKPTLVSTLRVDLSLLGAVVPIKNSDGDSYQFGIDSKTATIGAFTPKFLGGANPGPDYGFDPVGVGTASLVTMALSATTAHLLLTPPQLSHFAHLDYDISTAVRTTADSLNIGVDLVGVTVGDPNALVDLNRVSTSKGWKKTLFESVYSGYDDEYGAAIYESTWGPTKKRASGVHNTAVAVSLHKAAFNKVYKDLGRYRIFAAFEQQKFTAAQIRYAPLAGPFPKTRYDPDALALTTLESLSIDWEDDHLEIAGSGRNYEVIPVTATFSLKMRVVRTFFDGSTAFVMNYAQADGITGERYDVVLTHPDWIAGMIVLGLTTGILLLPHPGAVALAMWAIVEMIVGTVLGPVLGQWQDDLTPHALEEMSGFHTAMSYTLPDTDGPAFQVKCDDVVVRSNALTAWFAVTPKATPARIFLTASPNSTSTADVENVHWPAANLNKIVVRFTSGGSLFGPHDTHIKIRWKVWAESTNTSPIMTSDGPLSVWSRTITIDHASDELVKTKKFIIGCRVYRTWDDETHNLFHQQLHVEIIDKLDLAHPYVHWGHTVYYQGYTAPLGDPGREPRGWITEDRKSRIHYTDPKKRCRFADAFDNNIEPTYLDELPFPIEQADQHRKQICVYCFFGGPDKHVLK